MAFPALVATQILGYKSPMAVKIKYIFTVYSAFKKVYYSLLILYKKISKIYSHYFPIIIFLEEEEYVVYK